MRKNKKMMIRRMKKMKKMMKIKITIGETVKYQARNFEKLIEG